MEFEKVPFPLKGKFFVSGIIFCFLLFGGKNLPTLGQNWKIHPSNLNASGGKYRIPANFCLTDSKRSEIKSQLRNSIEDLHAKGKIPQNSKLFLPPSFIFPVRGNGAAINDYGVYAISNFVDQNPSYPNRLLDFNCGNRTYDTSGGYNHKGVDIFNWPFWWNKQDNDEVAVVAVADGTIIFKSNGNFDRSCFNNNNNWNAVYLRHFDGTVSWYGHLKNNSLTTKTVGQNVTQGEFLGIVGSSGNSTGPHLHFEIYDPGNQLRDPYQGPCNSLNSESYWLEQLPYRNSRINKLMTHSAPPILPGCPNPEIQNEKNEFQQGEQLIVAAYFSDALPGQISRYSIIQPNGEIISSWSHTSPETSTISYWYWTIPIPAEALNGIYTFRVGFQTKTYEHRFKVGLVNKPKFDFDGDGRTDVSNFRPNTGEWWYLRSSDKSNQAFQFGLASDKITPADFSGDGKTDIAIWRETTGEWFVLRSENNSFFSFPFGSIGDVPAPGDFDGDGKDDPGVFRPSIATWFINNSGGGITTRRFGAIDDFPIPNDYDGDGKDDIAIYRPNAQEWFIERSSDQQVLGFSFGSAGDRILPSDFTGDNKADLAVWRPSTGEWLVIRSEDNSFFGFPFGTNGDIPVPGDYDGDGKADAAVFRPSTQTWFLQQTTDGFEAVEFGIANDIPVPSAYIP